MGKALIIMMILAILVVVGIIHAEMKDRDL